MRCVCCLRPHSRASDFLLSRNRGKPRAGGNGGPAVGRRPTNGGSSGGGGGGGGSTSGGGGKAGAGVEEKANIGFTGSPRGETDVYYDRMIHVLTSLIGKRVECQVRVHLCLCGATVGFRSCATRTRRCFCLASLYLNFGSVTSYFYRLRLCTFATGARGQRMVGGHIQ